MLHKNLHEFGSQNEAMTFVPSNSEKCKLQVDDSVTHYFHHPYDR
jgi:hypothetical protein